MVGCRAWTGASKGLGSVMALGGCLLLAAPARATITFDNLQGGSVHDAPLGPSYEGLRWSNTYLLDVPAYFSAVGQSGYSNGLAEISIPNVGFTGFDNPATISSAHSFSLSSLLLGAGWYDDLGVDILGYRNGVLLGTRSFTVSASSVPILASVDFVGVDQVVISPDPGTGSPAGYAGCCHQVYFDNVDIPEPISFVPFLGGLIGLGVTRRFGRS